MKPISVEGKKPPDAFGTRSVGPEARGGLAQWARMLPSTTAAEECQAEYGKTRGCAFIVAAAAASTIVDGFTTGVRVGTFRVGFGLAR